MQQDRDGAAGPVYDRMAAGQDPWGWSPQPTRPASWNKQSPMWWHRSPGHRLFCIFGAIALMVAGYFLETLTVLVVLMTIGQA